MQISLRCFKNNRTTFYFNCNEEGGWKSNFLRNNQVLPIGQRLSSPSPKSKREQFILQIGHLSLSPLTLIQSQADISYFCSPPEIFLIYS
ncbi:hypothetical protein FGO68_gene14017 [Halteria grandinella]|uniref:Uncharacterized protein n=1 Tax=Halteria grandinella TaxID=5974 RepID=A0A8J8NC96_HALGN|nr:hypothetical protein FGO68_gene14017 [Halteria grandinella]